MSAAESWNDDHRVGLTGERASAHDRERSNRVPRPLTSLVGREREIDRLLDLLLKPENRLVTLTGPGGVGKTRLAIAAARRVETEAGVPVAFISLASIADPTLVASTIGAAFGLRESGDQDLAERLALVLRSEPFLLVLDNFEHLVEAAPIAAVLLAACPALRVMATSRRPLQLSGEVEYPVRPLPVPESSDPPETTEQTAAYRLFTERSPIVNSDVGQWKSVEAIVSIGEICRRLDGLPLAIELAAARARIFSPAELLDRLEQRLPMLTHGPRDAPARLQSMADAIAWSYDLLESDEQALFRRLSVYEGGFTIEAAEAMAEELAATPVDLIAALADLSLIQHLDTEYGPRFIMLETIREFGLSKLAERGELSDARDKHGDWLARKLGSSFLESTFSARRSQILQLPGDHDNLRSAIKWSLEQRRPEKAADLARGLSPYWNRTADHNEAVETWDAILLQCQNCPPEMRASLFGAIGGASYMRGDFERAMHCAWMSLDLHTMLESQLGVCGGLSLLGLITRWSDPGASVAHFAKAVSIAREVGGPAIEGEYIEWNLSQGALSLALLGHIDQSREQAQEAISRLQYADDGTFNRPVSIGTLGWTAGMAGELEDAEARGEEQLELSERFSVKEGLWYAHRVLGEVAFARHAFPLALRHFRQSLETIHQSGVYPQWRGFVLAELAMTAAELGDEERGAKLWGSASSIYDRFQFAKSTKLYGATWSGRYTMPPEMASTEKFAAAFESGRKLTDVQSYLVAMEVTPQSPAIRSSGLLTRRQLEVLELIVESCTNREIAERLCISKRTVDGHVISVLNALGVSTRRDAAREARKRHLLPS